ncbi:MAG: FAD-binding protein [Paludibacteraceae bacterium]|nr:FAD-binding protein [Paludibacteraceae bacterium]
MMEILTDRLHRTAYATDASVYREMPYGVAYPRSAEDIRWLIGEARRRETNIIPRAGGTSIAGQVVGNGIVADISRYMNRILEINPAGRYAWVEPGVVRDELNLACKEHGLFFSPETSTSNRCCIGGMTGNNSCGTHSLIYGSTRQHILEADGILADGTEEHFGEYCVAELEERFGKGFWEQDSPSDPLIQRIYAQLLRFAADEKTRRLIAESYPDKSLARRSCGYAIDEVIEGLCDESKPWEERKINLCKLLTGSEGTLAFLFRIKVSLDPLPPKHVMVVCAHCVSLEAAFEANLIALKHSPTAVELMDGEILELSKQSTNVERFFVEGDPPALLISELRSDSEQDLDGQAARLEQALRESGMVTVCTRVYGGDVGKVWNLRKAGLGILSRMKGDAKPTGVIEDTAVAPARLPAYMRDFREMLRRMGLSCVFYGHISTGELHLRPILNLKTEEGRRLFREVARETALLVRQHRGTISGEHGDGRLRGEFIPLQYGEEAWRLMRNVKRCWDADGIFNPHKIVDAPPMDEYLRVGKAGECPQDNALLCSVEQCNGAGDCRKSNLIGGTMCPAYKVSHDELQTTRARANVLREFLQSLPAVDSRDVRDVLATCLACKGCRKECPSGVDMTRMRAEVLQQLYDREGTPMRTWLVVHNADIQRLGSWFPHIYNFFATNRFTSSLLKHIVGFAQERSIPKINTKCLTFTHKHAVTNTQSPTRSVFLFFDEFTRYQEPELALTFIRLLERLGYRVVIPKHVESGRAAVSKGMLRLARRYAEKNVRMLKDIVSEETPLVGIEPSTILTFRDEYPALVKEGQRKDAEELARHCLLFDEFMMREVEAGRITAKMFSDLPVEIWLHGHCHQKALVGVEKTAALLDLPRGTEVHVIPSGCCGMAGSFGYEQAHYRTSLAIGEMILFPAVRKAVKESGGTPVLVAAPGTSCRTQIYDGTGIRARHPIEILYSMLKE